MASPLLTQTRYGWEVHHRKPCDCQNGLDTRFHDSDGDYFRCEATDCDGETFFDDACACKECKALQVEADALNAAAFAATERSAA